MPLPATANMGLVRPTELGDAGLWASLVNTIFSQLDVHDHTNGRGVQVPSAGLNINADVAWGTHKLTGLAALAFTPVSGTVGGAVHESLFTGDGTGATVANELYWTAADGTLVKMTSGGTLNVAGFTGGIVGDYPVVGAIVTYDTATQRYKFETSTADGHGWARLMTGGVRIGILNDTNNSHYVEHAVSGAIATAYTVTWPATQAAAAGTLVQLDNTGVVTFGNTGLAGLTAAANQHITVSGTGAFKHGTQTLVLPVVPPQTPALSTPSLTINPGSAGASIGIPLAAGRRITALRAVIRDNVTGPTKLALSLSTASAGSATSNVATGSASSGAGSTQTINVTGLTTTVASGTVYYATINATTGSASCTLYAVEVDYDYP